MHESGASCLASRARLRGVIKMEVFYRKEDGVRTPLEKKKNGSSWKKVRVRGDGSFSWPELYFFHWLSEKKISLSPTA